VAVKPRRILSSAPPPPPRRSRSRRLLLFAAVVGGAIVAALAMQVVILTRPSRSKLDAVEVARWLVRHRVVDGVWRAPDGRLLTSTCVGSWIGPGRLVRQRVRASLLVLGPPRTALVGVRGRIYAGRARLRRDRSAASRAAFQRAGCPWWLGSRLGEVLVQNGNVSVTDVTLGSRRVARVVFGRKAARTELYVASGTWVPVAIRAVPHPGPLAQLHPGTLAQTKRVLRFFKPITRGRTGQ
jgi:uncharacterized membrane protein YsdA (DUF1294 family)